MITLLKKKFWAHEAGWRLACSLLDADDCWRHVCLLRGYEVPGPVATCEMAFARTAVIRDAIKRRQPEEIAEEMLAAVSEVTANSFAAEEDTEVTLKHYDGARLSVVAPRIIGLYEENAFPLTQLASVFAQRLSVPGFSVEIADLFEHVAAAAERAMKSAKIVAFPSRDKTLVAMINLRLGRYPWWRRPQSATHWPMFRCWASPEAVILNTVDDFWWLKDGGLSDQLALQRLEVLSSGNNILAPSRNSSLRELIARKVDTVDPTLLALGDRLFDQEIEIANKWVQDHIKFVKSQPAFPPAEWLRERITIDHIGHATRGKSADWDRIRSRCTDRDELWKFSSPSDYWEGLAGRAGFALIRDGRAIAHVITMMN
jgi:hypothetical protein